MGEEAEAPTDVGTGAFIRESKEGAGTAGSQTDCTLENWGLKRVRKRALHKSSLQPLIFGGEHWNHSK